MKRATAEHCAPPLSDSISIHALVKRATYSNCLRQTATHDFNPRPREEGDQSGRRDIRQQAISIHALVKRATLNNNNKRSVYNISIHALVKRATEISY